MAEELDYVPMPAKVVARHPEDLGVRDQGCRRQAAVRADQLIRAATGGALQTAPFSLSTSNCRVASCVGGSRPLDCSFDGQRGSDRCSPSGGIPWPTLHCRADAPKPRDALSRAKVLRSPASRRHHLPQHHPRRRARGAGDSRRRDRRADRPARCRRCATFGLELPHRRELEPGDREIRRARADLRHDRHLAHRHADRGAGRADDRVLPDRAVPAVAAPADRHRDRAARRHPEHHLRHLGPVRLRAVPAAIRPAGPDRAVRQRFRCSRRCSPARPTASAC